MNAEILVIGNVDNGLNSLTKEQVQAIFMGRTRTFSNGWRALPINETGLWKDFYDKLTGRSIKQIDAYWTRIMFSGNSIYLSIRDGQQSVIDEIKGSKEKVSYS